MLDDRAGEIAVCVCVCVCNECIVWRAILPGGLVPSSAKFENTIVLALGIAIGPQPAP